ncbi:hypothetical protein PFISCL1PPCAC_15057 [Pristionchus fissidentatus]|uniref:Uncharacterized protein n=1 Tax=Pristionchus fissidentatus TaxID=1538716 RepID=A0AAV5W0D8_9BILA|nr:hypothetical protein PFISCL1PPCAC_15057 [Pristionchus fissidentatus]
MVSHILPLSLLLLVSPVLAINCHACAGRDFLGATVQAVLQSFGAPYLIAPAGNCSDRAQTCPSTSYCFKRTDYYNIGGFWHEAHYWAKGCDINAVAGSTVAYQPNKCVQYDQQRVNGYKVTRKICACNDKDLCNSSLSLSLFSSFFVIAAAIFFY